MGDREIGPEMPLVRVEWLGSTTGAVGVAVVEAVEDAFAKDALGHLDDKGVSDDIAEDIGRKGWWALLEMTAQPPSSTPLLCFDERV